MQLNNLQSLVKKSKRVGRGGSRGGTSGKGHKGQKARSGGHATRRGFEGGQMPLSRRLPKVGFNNQRFSQCFEIVNIAQLETRCTDGQQIGRQELIDLNLIKGKRGAYIKILGDGAITKKLIIAVDAISAYAREQIEKAGGTVQLTREI